MSDIQDIIDARRQNKRDFWVAVGISFFFLALLFAH